MLSPVRIELGTSEVLDIRSNWILKHVLKIIHVKRDELTIVGVFLPDSEVVQPAVTKPVRVSVIITKQDDIVSTAGICICGLG